MAKKLKTKLEKNLEKYQQESKYCEVCPEENRKKSMVGINVLMLARL